mmetsp:Transcript_19006/g.52327  ORF Transcript_19006/g.52327 Transcript_19006/m.52327 type:complete len:189 (+) Transcript_19006:2-568(+)
MAFCSLTPENKRKMTSTESDVRMQNAIWMDMAAFLTTYPQLQKALKYGLGALVRTRPPDPFSFLAEKLREANRKEKIVVKGKALTEEEAAVRIQARGRGMRDRQIVKEKKQEAQKQKAATRIQSVQRGIAARNRTEALRNANIVWLRELFLRLCSDSKVEAPTVSARVVFDYCRRDPALVTRLGLTRR